MDEIQNDENLQKQGIEDNLKIEKANRLNDFEDRLKATGSQKEFNKVLGEYQKA